MYGQPVVGCCEEYGGHGGGAGHVRLHFLHVVVGFDVEAAGVVHDAFADEAYGGLAVDRGRVVFEDYEAWFVDGAAVDGEKSAEPEAFYLFFVHDGACDVVEVGGNGSEFVGESGCVEVLHGDVDPFAAPEYAVP